MSLALLTFVEFEFETTHEVLVKFISIFFACWNALKLLRQMIYV